ncbi:MAG: CcmD family protein [Candidatus Latescibacteria bacterium]|nr:CcmD family protein [Candidatus Latescibacterota bacterium]
MDTFPNLFAGYAAIWIIFFGFVWRLQSRQKQQLQEIALLQQKLAAVQQERPS